VPLRAVVALDPKSKQTINVNTYRGKWVSVTARLHFFETVAGSNQYRAVLLVTSSR
jgi:hypothetical protein